MKKNTVVKTEEVRKELFKLCKKLKNLRNRTKIGTARRRYINVIMNWISFLRRIELKDAKNLEFLDFTDIYKLKEGKVGVEIIKEEK